MSVKMYLTKSLYDVEYKFIKYLSNLKGLITLDYSIECFDCTMFLVHLLRKTLEVHDEK